MLQCMTDPEDVQEYVDGKVEMSHIHRLLEWLETTRVDDAKSVVSAYVDVSSKIKIYAFNYRNRLMLCFILELNISLGCIFHFTLFLALPS